MRTFHCKPVHAAAAFLLALGLTGAAQAGLGDRVDSVGRDQSATKAGALAVTHAAAYDIHEMTTGAGVVLREYVSRTGTVFAVTWSGRSAPDLSVVLSKFYQNYLQAAAAPHHDHKVLTVQGADFALSIHKLPRRFVGSASIPSLMPAGTTAANFL